jgi:hypothetical protein
LSDFDRETEPFCLKIVFSSNARITERARIAAASRTGQIAHFRVVTLFIVPGNGFCSAREKGGKEKELPVHHKLEELLDQYLKATGFQVRSMSLSQSSFPAFDDCLWAKRIAEGYRWVQD